MELIIGIIVLFFVGVVAYFLLAALVSVGFFVALGLTFLMCFAACVATVNHEVKQEASVKEAPINQKEK